MIPWQEYDQILQEKLSDKRYHHSMAVTERAVFLAKKHDVDPEKARLAGMLHDVMKNEESRKLLQFIQKSGILLSDTDENAPPIWHAIGGYVYARDVLHIEDEDVLRAIRYHTTGRAGMSALEKVIYLADLTSSDREYNDVDKIRQISEQSLNRGMKFAMNFLVCDLVKRNRSLHQDTVDCYNELVKAGVKE